MKYEDYRKDELVDEIDSAAQGTQERKEQRAIPSQFDGKSAEEIAQSYAELKAMTDRQANELGETRRTNAMLTERLTSPDFAPEAPAPAEPKVTVDDIYADPDAAINRVVDARVEDALQEIRQEQENSRAQKALTDFEAKFPGYQEDANSPEMQNWLDSSPYRSKMADKVRAGDLDAASELFEMYRDLKDRSSGTDAEERNRQLQDAGLETPVGRLPAHIETFSRAELQNMRIMAKRGNMEAMAYMTKNADAIKAAYEERRIVD